MSAHAVSLPAVSLSGPLSQLLVRRFSQRDYSAAPLTLAELAALLWAAQGMTQHDGQRTAPSAGALYPLELYCVVGDISGLEPGVYHYRPALHALAQHQSGDRRVELADAALDQDWIAVAPLVLVLAAVFNRTTRKYGERGVRYVHIEVGHAAQNVCLMAASLGLGSVTVGAFEDAAVQALLQLPESEAPLYLLPVGRQ
ncbi:MAG TPA: SagB/ThcOx family dehydrogenase [Acidiferrobacterales bacterium]|nr:SagB/ThcOx family dehydrogenase [Acidiferrobacterales bacterium]